MRILIVEDDPDGGEMLAEFMRELGHQAKVAATGAAALSAMAEAPDVAFVDLLLPDMHGIELAERLLARSPRTTLVALTGLVSRESEARARQAGFRHYLLKPYRMDDIEAILAGVRANQ